MDLKLLEDGLELSFRVSKLKNFQADKKFTQMFKSLIKMITSLVIQQRQYVQYCLKVTKVTIQFVDLLRGLMGHENLIE